MEPVETEMYAGGESDLYLHSLRRRSQSRKETLMPILNRAAKLIAKPVPRMMKPKTHAVLDYISVGAFLTSALWFWKRNKRAAVAGLICGGAELVVDLLTDYPGGVKPVISYRKHLEIDLGLAAVAATMPEFLFFNNDPEKKFFLTQGAITTLASELSQVSTSKLAEERKKQMKAA